MREVSSAGKQVVMFVGGGGRIDVSVVEQKDAWHMVLGGTWIAATAGATKAA